MRSLLRAIPAVPLSDRAISIGPDRSEILKIPVPAGSDLNKGAGVVVLGCSQHERGRAGFDDAPVLHDHDRVADLRGDAQIVRDAFVTVREFRLPSCRYITGGRA